MNTLTFSEVLNFISRFVEWWQSPLSRALVFVIIWILVYLPVSGVLYAQVALWTGAKVSKTATYLIAVIAALVGDLFAYWGVSFITKMVKWWTTPQNLINLDYQPFWAIVFAVVAVIVLPPFYGTWYELRRWRKANEQFRYNEERVK